ncbi:MAG: hypothetical protein J6W75_04590 [Bacteroidaceae bacterium]|nr:hypothetical protein [Bacteroidaceae bacterium]
MIRKLIIAICLLTAMPLVAQDEMQKINEIKKSQNYLWEQFSDESADTAITKASEILLKQLQATDPELTLDDLKAILKKIVIKRETITRTFVYLNPAELKQAKDILPQHNFAAEIIKCKDFKQVFAELMPAAKKDGRILDFGPMKGADEIGKRYLVIFDKTDQHLPIAVLSPERDNEGLRGNLVSHAEARLSDYKGHPAIWFTMKE